MDNASLLSIAIIISIYYSGIMGKQKLNQNVIEKIKDMRSKGFSLPEIKKELGIGHGTVFRYIKGVEILPEYRELWNKKRGGSIRRKMEDELKAKQEAETVISHLDLTGKLIFLSALYWAEGNKKDLNFMNSDPNMIKVFITGIQEVFGVTYDRIRVSIRVFEDLNQESCIAFWSSITGVSPEKFSKIEVKLGKKSGKLPYGMCRVRVLKGSPLLKKLTAIRIRSSELFKPS